MGEMGETGETTKLMNRHISRFFERLPMGLALALLLALRTQAGAGVERASSQGADGETLYSPLPQSVQEDLGDIRPAASASVLSYFHGQATVSGQYLSNGPLFHSRDRADFLILPSLQGGFTAPLGQHFKVDVEARVEDYTYVSHSPLGFWGVSGNADIEYRYKPSWPGIYAGIAPYYYLSYSDGNRLTAALGPVAGIEQSITINRGKTLLMMGYNFGQYYASPGIDTRQSHTLTLALTQQIRPSLYAEVYWEGEYSIYTEDNRDEMLDIVGLTLIHQFNPHLFLSVFVNYADNASNNGLAKYETINTGAGLTLQY